MPVKASKNPVYFGVAGSGGKKKSEKMMVVWHSNRLKEYSKFWFLDLVHTNLAVMYTRTCCTLCGDEVHYDHFLAAWTSSLRPGWKSCRLLPRMPSRRITCFLCIAIAWPMVVCSVSRGNSVRRIPSRKIREKKLSRSWRNCKTLLCNVTN